MPTSIRTHDDRTFTMNGMPLDWALLWLKLAGRFPRPRHNSPPETAQDPASETGASSIWRNSGPTAEPPPALPNSVTGTNYLPSARRREVSAHALRTRVASMPTSLTADAIVAGQLYFINIPDFEGELRVGLGRVEAEMSEDGTKRRVNWLQRRVWSNNPAEDDFLWQLTPRFKAARQQHSRLTQSSFEPTEAFLPVPSELTTSWGHHEPTLPLAHKKQRFKLTKRCMTQLIEFIRLTRPELRRSPNDALSMQQVSPATTDAPAAASASNATAATTTHSTRKVRPGGKSRRRMLTDSSDSSDVDSSDPPSDDEQLPAKAREVQVSEEQHEAHSTTGQAGPSGTASASAAEPRPNKRPRRARNAVDRFA
eukprot:6177504-Pleurochrysis_carterae.AAC.1